ncbi:MAG TPA: diguanylate cyclase, partial [Pseudonocardiaceae bacterium]|nr:diguanylate cyclase [Pseudonocardiaceae bacterium]
MRAWSDGLSTTGYVPLAPEEIDEILVGMVDELFRALGQPDYSPRPAMAVGARLVVTGFTGERSLGVSVEVLGFGLPAQHELVDVKGLPGRVTSLLGALATGYTGEFRRWTLDQQEAAKRALLRAKDEAERGRRVSEARFREVFEAAPLGVVISQLTGSITAGNAALSEIFGDQPAELARRDIGELFHPDDAGRMSGAYQELTMGRRHRYRTRAKLATLEDANWASVSVSVLRDADGNPTHHVTMVEDFGDVHLLEQQLRHQTLHDLLTGLPNQEYFWIHLRAILEGAGPGTTITLCKIDLDRFAAVNDGHGHEAGNEVLRAVGRRLQALITGEQAMVARFGADEFVLVIEDCTTIRDVSSLATEISSALSEPIQYGGHALTVSAGIGMV